MKNNYKEIILKQRQQKESYFSRDLHGMDLRAKVSSKFSAIFDFDFGYM